MKRIDENYFKMTEEKKISSPDELLAPDEKILWKGKPKKFSYVMGKSIGMMPIAIIWGIIDISILVSVFSSGGISNGGGFIIVFLIGFFALHLMPVWIWLGSIFKAAREMNSIQYMITNKRVVEMRGRGNIYINAEIYLDDMDGASLKKSFIDRMLRVGDIYITTKDLKTVILFDIPNSDFICSRIEQLCANNVKPKTRKTAFYSNNHECTHCGTYYDAAKNKCPSCGAPTEK